MTGAVVYVARRLPVGRGTRLLLIAAIAAVGGMAVATMVAGAQASGSVDRFVTWSHPIEATVLADPVTPMADQVHVLAPVATLPSVVASMRVAIIVVSVRARPTAAPAPMVAYDFVDPPTSDIFRLRVIDGRLARSDRPDEVTVNETLARRLRLRVGRRFEVSTYAPGVVDQLGNGIVPPVPRSRVMLRVVGVVRSPGDLESHPEAQPGTPYEFNSSRFYATPAFWRRDAEGAAGYGVQVGVRVARGDLGALSRDIRRTHFAGRVGIDPGNPELSDRTSLARSTGIESAALWALGGLIAFVGSLLVGPTLRRSVAVSADRRHSLSALGFTRIDLTLLEVRRSLPIVGLGALLCVPVAIAASPWEAFGTSASAELHGGVVVRPAFLAVGALVVAAVLLAVVALAAWTSAPHRAVARTAPRRPDRLASGVAARAPLAVAMATRLIAPGGGRNRGAARSAVVAVTVGVALLVGAVGFGASMGHLVASPRLRGWTWDVEAGNYAGHGTSAKAAKFLAADHDVDAWAGFNSTQVQGPGGKVDLVGVDDPEAMRLVALTGRLPRDDGEVALTPHTLAIVHRHLGDRIALHGQHARRLRIVGTTAGPGAMETDMQLRDGGLVTLSELGRLDGPSGYASGYLVRLRHDVPRRAAIASLRPEFHDTVLGPYATSDVETIRRAEPLPRWFAIGVASLALGTLTYAMGSMLRRNRRDVALLKTLGSDRRGIRSVVVDQAYLIAVPGVLVGIPLGLILSRWAWRLAVQGIGIVTDPVAPWLVVGAVALGAMVVVGAIGLRAAGRAIRVPVAATLRAE